MPKHIEFHSFIPVLRNCQFLIPLVLNTDQPFAGQNRLKFYTMQTIIISSWWWKCSAAFHQIQQNTRDSFLFSSLSPVAGAAVCQTVKSVLGRTISSVCAGVRNKAGRGRGNSPKWGRHTGEWNNKSIKLRPENLTYANYWTICEPRIRSC